MIAGGILCLLRSAPIGAAVILAVALVRSGVGLPEPWFSVFCAFVWLLAAYWAFKFDALVGALFVIVALPSVAFALGFIPENVRYWIDEPAVFLALAAGLYRGNGPTIADCLRPTGRFRDLFIVASSQGDLAGSATRASKVD